MYATYVFDPRYMLSINDLWFKDIDRLQDLLYIRLEVRFDHSHTSSESLLHAQYSLMMYNGCHIRYRLIMHTYLLLTDVTCYACYQSIMQATHSIEWKCILALLMVDTVTAHMMYILHQWTCYPLIVHIMHDIDLSCSLLHAIDYTC